MAGGWPIGSEVCNGTDQGTVTASSVGTTITSSSTANTYGSWTQLVASSAIDCCWLVISSTTVFANTANDIVIDIGVGASGSEKVIISAIHTIGNNAWPSLTRFAFPCQIAAGTRIAARSQSNGTSQGAYVQVTLFDGEWNALEGAEGVVDTYGFQSGTTLGAAIDPGATVNTKGSYTQLTASSTADLLGFMLAFDFQNDTAGAGVQNQFLLDIATGASGSEKVLIPNIAFNFMSDGAGDGCYIKPEFIPFIPCPIPSGTRIAARAQATINTATTRVFGLTFYGVRA